MMKGNVGTGLAVGIGAALLAPVVLPALGGLLRPVAKGVIKAGLIVYDRGREATASLSEMTGDLAAEARAEMHAREAGAQPQTAGGASG
jgi:hypothetical protein